MRAVAAALVLVASGASLRGPVSYLPPHPMMPVYPRIKTDIVARPVPGVPLADNVLVGATATPPPILNADGYAVTAAPRGFEAWYQTPAPVVRAPGYIDYQYMYEHPCVGTLNPCPTFR